MGFLKTDYSNVNTDFAPLPVGDYECMVSEVKVTEAQTSKNPMIKVTLTVRDDVEQAGQKRKFFDNIVQVDNMMWKFNQVSKACQLPEGADFETLEEFAQAILYKPVVIRNKHREYNGEKQDSVGTWKVSELEGAAGAYDAGMPDIQDDDLPF